VDTDAVTALWARAHLRDLEDRYVAGTASLAGLEKHIVDTSLRFGVLCRFTAYVAVDSRVVAAGGPEHRVVQPVELPAGWQLPVPRSAPVHLARMTLAGTSAVLPPMASPPAAPSSLPSGPPSFWAGAPAADAALDRAAPPLVPPALTEARELVSEELLRLRVDPGGLPGYQRMELLADLASRLRAMLAHLRARGIAEDAAAPVRELVAAIEAGGDVDALWERAVRVLDAFLGGGAVGGGGDAPSAGRRAFWKRH
jgi:Ca-activated chloride channel family protein